MWFLKEATNLEPDTALSLISVTLRDALNTVGALAPSTITILSVPSKLNLSKLYFEAPVLPLSRTVHVSDTILLSACVAAVVLLVALVTPVKDVAVTPV